MSLVDSPASTSAAMSRSRADKATAHKQRHDLGTVCGLDADRNMTSRFREGSGMHREPVPAGRGLASRSWSGGRRRRAGLRVGLRYNAWQLKSPGRA